MTWLPPMAERERMRSIAALLLAASGLVLEVTAVALLTPAWPVTPWVAFFLCHAGGAAAVAGAQFLRLPSRHRTPALPAAALFFVLAFLVPLLGPAVSWAALAFATRYPARDQTTGIALLRAPEQAQPTGPRAGNYGHGAIRPLLANPDAPAPRRFKALLALEHVPARRASELLRNVLNDADEDIRLVAHGILDKREKAVQEALTLAQVQLAAARGTARLTALRRVAQLQWELIYGELAIGDVRVHLVASTIARVEEALALAPAEPGLWYMRGRLALESGADGEAQRCMEEALRCGLPRGRALPWLAEVAFRARDYERTRRCLRELAGAPLESAVSLSVRYWCGEPA